MSTQFQPYNIVSQVTRLPDRPLRVAETLRAGSKVRTDSGINLRFVASLGSGGEGEIFSTDRPDVVAKIYHPNRLTMRRFEKLRVMRRGLDWTDQATYGICWPLAILYTNHGVFCGYAMRKAKGKPLGNSLFVRSELEATFPSWDRSQLVTLSHTILGKIRILHDANVLLGDINPQNFLIDDENSVFLVDCDSYQVDAFPCPVGSIDFTPPELQGVDFSTTLRTSTHESFAVATLLFLILLLGKHPYAQVGGESPADNIRRMEFPYALGKRSTGRAPAGPWRYMWSNLPFALKQAFFESFDKSCSNLPRRSAVEWTALLRDYLCALKAGHLSRELFPNTMKSVSPFAAQKYGVKIPNATSGRKIRCVDCQTDFVLSGSEEQFFKARGLSVPRRCRTCREQRKLAGVCGASLPSRRHPVVAPQSLWQSFRSLFLKP